jgi:hypothetical protein
VLKKSALFLGFRGLNSVVEFVGIAVGPMKWRVPTAVIKPPARKNPAIQIAFVPGVRRKRVSALSSGN